MLHHNHDHHHYQQLGNRNTQYDSPHHHFLFENFFNVNSVIIAVVITIADSDSVIKRKRIER